jgi:chromosome segregation ATPase
LHPDEFQTSSKELEEELERELESTERQMTDLRNRVERVERERDDCKSKLSNLQGTHNTTVNSLQRELDGAFYETCPNELKANLIVLAALRQQHSLIKVQLRELEVGNDDLERSERAVSSSLADLEGRYARALEEKIMLEHELQDRVALEEDMQRLKDELRGTSHSFLKRCSLMSLFEQRLSRSRLFSKSKTHAFQNSTAQWKSRTDIYPMSLLG